MQLAPPPSLPAVANPTLRSRLVQMPKPRAKLSEQRELPAGWERIAESDALRDAMAYREYQRLHEDYVDKDDAPADRLVSAMLVPEALPPTIARPKDYVHGVSSAQSDMDEREQGEGTGKTSDERQVERRRAIESAFPGATWKDSLLRWLLLRWGSLADAASAMRMPVPSATVIRKLPYLAHKQRRKMIQESIEIERLRIAEGMYAKGEMKNVTLHARPSGREQRRKFAIRHTPGCRDLVFINGALLVFLTTFRVFIETSIAPSARASMSF